MEKTYFARWVMKASDGRILEEGWTFQPVRDAEVLKAWIEFLQNERQEHWADRRQIATFVLKACNLL